jgi:hypothetical protein
MKLTQMMLVCWDSLRLWSTLMVSDPDQTPTSGLVVAAHGARKPFRMLTTNRLTRSHMLQAIPCSISWTGRVGSSSPTHQPVLQQTVPVQVAAGAYRWAGLAGCTGSVAALRQSALSSAFVPSHSRPAMRPCTPVAAPAASAAGAARCAGCWRCQLSQNRKVM